MIIKRIIDALKRRVDRYVLIPLARRRFREMNILSSEDSIKYIIEHRCSVSRFGDGEFDIIQGRSEGYQTPNEKLALLLKQVLTSMDAPNHMVAIPLPLKDVSKIAVKVTKEFWGYFDLKHGKEVHSLLSSQRVYLDTQLSRFYYMYRNRAYSERILKQLQEIWNEKDIVIIEGTQTRSGVGNDLYDNARSVKRILGPATNAIDKYDEMLDAICKYVDKNKLILLSYGPTATILAYDLAKLGYWAIDLGHMDIEYEWYRNKDPKGGVVKGKYTNEALGGNIVEECTDEQYLSQIICDITR